MENFRCVIADIAHFMLADIVQRITEQHLKVEYFNNIEDGTISALVQQNDVDVVLTSFESLELPKFCNDLLEECSDIAVVGLVEDGRRICICVDDAGPHELIELIRAVIQDKKNKY